MILANQQGRRARRQATCKRRFPCGNLSAEKVQGRHVGRFHVRSSVADSARRKVRMTPQVRRIRADESLRLRALRLHALAEAPMAYSSTLAHEQRYPDDVWRERAVGASIGCDRATFIAEHNGRWVGLATGLARPDDSESAAPLLVGMFVDGNARRAGVGVALVEAISGWARACGARRLTLWVTIGNDPAVALYQRCGFRPTGLTKPLPHTPTYVECEMMRDLVAGTKR